jgi:membrane-associated protease RseP (regulator of RpoE activity)
VNSESQFPSDTVELVEGSESEQRRSAVPVWQPAKPKPQNFGRAVALFALTFVTCLAAGRQFAISFANNRAASFDEFVVSLKLLYKDPTALGPGLPFALALMGILLAHELGHYFACRYHGIRSSYPYFIPAPSLVGTFGAFILMRSPIRSRRALFDVGASGPLVGFVVAIPFLIYGVMHSRVAPGLNSAPADVVFGLPLAVRLVERAVFPGIDANSILLHPVARAAWVGLFATSLNLLPAGQLDGGHIVRALSARWHRSIGWMVPLVLVALGFRNPSPTVWLVWAGILLALRFLRIPPVYDERPLDRARVALAVGALIVMVLCFMPSPVWEPTKASATDVFLEGLKPLFSVISMRG